MNMLHINLTIICVWLNIGFCFSQKSKLHKGTGAVQVYYSTTVLQYYSTSAVVSLRLV